MSIENTYTRLTGSGIVVNGTGVLSGMRVNSTNSGTVKLYDYLSATGTVINNTMTPAVGYHDLGSVQLTTGCYAEIGGTAIDVTFYVKAAN
jgi:hypothetical protein